MRASNQMNARRRSGRGRAITLAGVLTIQVLCAVIFVADVVADLHWLGLDMHTLFEAAVAFALILGIILGALEMRRTLERNKRAEAAWSTASGRFAELIQSQFEDWRLTPAESDVALLALKGFDVGEIAALRKAATGTVRAQLARVYAKSGVSNRAQLVSVFVEDLLGAPIAGQSPSNREKVQ